MGAKIDEMMRRLAALEAHNERHCRACAVDAQQARDLAAAAQERALRERDEADIVRRARERPRVRVSLAPGQRAVELRRRNDEGEVVHFVVDAVNGPRHHDELADSWTARLEYDDELRGLVETGVLLVGEVPLVERVYLERNHK